MAVIILIIKAKFIAYTQHIAPINDILLSLQNEDVTFASQYVANEPKIIFKINDWSVLKKLRSTGAADCCRWSLDGCIISV